MSTGRLLFWSDWGLRHIARSAMDGTRRQVIASKHVEWASALSLDYPVKRVYWTDVMLDVVSSMAYDGSDRRKLPLLLGNARPVAIEVFRNSLFISDRGRKVVVEVNKFSGNGSSDVVGAGARAVLDLKVHHPAQQPLAPNPCGVKNCGCSHLCLIAVNANCSCFCQIGFELEPNGKTCKPLEKFLLYARRTELAGVSLASGTNDAIHPITDFGHVVAVDFDSKESKLYFSDIVRDNISRVDVTGGALEVVIHSTRNVDGLAVDWLGRNLYWTDNDAHELAVAKLNGSFRKALFTDLKRPRAIALDPQGG